MLYLDTHIVAWLYAGKVELLSQTAQDLIEENDTLLISPIVQLELEYLKEINRITVSSALIVESLALSIGLQICDQSFIRVITESIQQDWTRDPFDRVIVAQASINSAKLISRDRIIIKHYSNAIW
jgi:PIN domain nuclease of toxin-antitoxin system